MLVATVFENLESGASIEEIMEWFGVTREQIQAVLEFAARSLDAPPPATIRRFLPMRILFDQGTPAPLIAFLEAHAVAQARAIIYLTNPYIWVSICAWKRNQKLFKKRFCILPTLTTA
jgi:hypothetical protein